METENIFFGAECHHVAPKKICHRKTLKPQRFQGFFVPKFRVKIKRYFSVLGGPELPPPRFWGRIGKVFPPQLRPFPLSAGKNVVEISSGFLLHVTTVFPPKPRKKYSPYNRAPVSSNRLAFNYRKGWWHETSQRVELCGSLWAL